MNRRRFLESSGACLMALGWNALQLSRAGDQYAKFLAQGTNRKLALLVGINAYPESTLFAPLFGCVTDVRLQRELLIHRFGFHPSDILTLTDAQATRTGILEAFREHLIRQARPGDVVVFHFSGHGSRIADPDRDHSDGLNSTFVPVDSRLPAGFPSSGGVVQDITGHTFFLLSRAVASENFTAVLDSCHSGGGTRGNLRIRARDGNAKLEISPGELELQASLLKQLNLNRQAFIAQRRVGVANGVVLAGAARDQLAADATFDDVDCGVFTYLLTQYLWQQTRSSPVRSLLPNISRSTTRLSTTRQEPLYEVKPGSGNEGHALFSLNQTLPPADGVLTSAGSGGVEFWLGGVDPQGLAALGAGTLYSLVDKRGAVLGEVTLESRKGLVGQGKVVKASVALTPGLLVQERLRDLPSDVQLVIGLDPTLGAALPTAQRALSQLPRLRATPLQKGEVHYIFGRFRPDSEWHPTAGGSSDPDPEKGSLGLFSPGGEPVPRAFGGRDETAEAAVQRLRPKFKALLAARIFRLALNGDSSRLNVVVSMRPEGQAGTQLARTFPTRGVGPAPKGATGPTSTDGRTPRRLPLGSAVQFEVRNLETTPIYLSLLVIDPAGEMTVIFPNNWTADADATRVAAGTSLLIPDPLSDGFRLVTQEPRGTVEVLIVASRHPIRQALKGFQAIAGQSGQTRGPVPLAEPVGAVEGLLNDLVTGSAGTRGTGTGSRGLMAVGRGLDSSQIATLSLTFEVI